MNFGAGHSVSELKNRPKCGLQVGEGSDRVQGAASIQAATRGNPLIGGHSLLADAGKVSRSVAPKRLRLREVGAVNGA